MNDNDFPKVRGVGEVLTSALKTGSVIFIILTILDAMMKIVFAIVYAILDRLFGDFRSKINQSTSKTADAIEYERFINEELPKMSAGKQLEYKHEMQKLQDQVIKIYVNNNNKL